jgi:hypothetical protein
MQIVGTSRAIEIEKLKRRKDAEQAQFKNDLLKAFLEAESEAARNEECKATRTVINPHVGDKVHVTVEWELNGG